jgi:hypothetical protein
MLVSLHAGPDGYVWVLLTTNSLRYIDPTFYGEADYDPRSLLDAPDDATLSAFTAAMQLAHNTNAGLVDADTFRTAVERAQPRPHPYPRLVRTALSTPNGPLVNHPPEPGRNPI